MDPHQKTVIPIGSRAWVRQNQQQMPDVLVIYTHIQLSLQKMTKKEVHMFIGIDELNIKSIASSTQAQVTYDPSTHTLTIGGRLHHVKAAYGAFSYQLAKLKERDAFNETDFILFSREFADGLMFVPGKDSKSWNLQPCTLDDISLLADGNLAHTVERVATELLKKLSYLAVRRDHGLKMNLNLGKSTFSKPSTSDVILEGATFTPGQLTGLLKSEEVCCTYDLSFDEATLATLESTLLSLGYQKSLTPKTRVYISYREIGEDSGKKSREILWVAKHKEPQTGKNKGCLDMVDVRVNEVRTCLITTHSKFNALDCNAEFTIYQKEIPSTILVHKSRLGHNFRYREGADTLISSKEELKDPSAKVQCSITYRRDDIKVKIIEIHESGSLVGAWEVCVNSGKLKHTIRSAISKHNVTNAQLFSELSNYFAAVSQIRTSVIGLGDISEVSSNNVQILTAKPTVSNKLNSNMEPFQPNNQPDTPHSSSEESCGATKADGKVGSVPSIDDDELSCISPDVYKDLSQLEF